LVIALLCTPCCSQTSSATINGTIRDPSDGTVSGARVTLTNADTGGAITRRSGSGGLYVIVNIPPGNYTLSVMEPGFATAKEARFGLQVNDTQTHDIKLAIGDVTQTVYVRADVPLLQQSSSELGTVIDEEAVRSLPLNGRNFSQLLSVTPGATPISTAQGSAGGTSFNAPVALPGSAFTLPAINGQWNRSNMYLLDGVVNHWFFGASWAVLPILESVQEFKVQSHNDKAEYGGVLGGIMNVVSKSGTNDLHGEAWWFLRNDAVDARNPFTDATSNGPTPFRQNQFGAAVGGPVLRNRTFFHLNYEGWRYRRAQQQTYFAPTDAELAGDFSESLLNNAIYDPSACDTTPSTSPN
jgi:hypothetical protein